MTSFIGRTDLLKSLDDEVAAGRVVGLVGPSGIGKTTLAREWLEQQERAYLAVDALHLSSMEVAANVLDVTGDIPETRLDEKELWASAAMALDDYDILFVDDVEFPIATLNDLSLLWNGAILLTTRQPPDEAFMPLSVPPLNTTGESGSDAARLFVAAAKTTDRRFDPDESPEAMASILAICEGFPLAIVLAARWSATLSCQAVCELIESGTVPKAPENPERHRSIAAALHFSCEQLTPDQRGQIYAMSIMRSPVSVGTLSQLCGSPKGETASDLHQLVQLSIVGRGPDFRPLSLFADHARLHFPKEHPQRADAIEERLVELAVSRARHRAPELTIFVLPDTTGPLCQAALAFSPRLDDEDLSPVLAVWLHWLAFRVSAADRKRLIEDAETLFERADDWRVWYWLQRLLRYERDQRVGEVIKRTKLAARTPVQLRDTLIHEAQFHLLNLRLDDAEKALTRAVAEAEPSHLYYSMQAELLLYQGRPKEALEATRKGEGMLDPEDEIPRARLEMLRSQCEKEPDSKASRIERARDVYRRKKLIGAQGWSAHWLGNVVGRGQDRYDDALVLFDEARHHYRSTGRQRDVAVIDFEEALLQLHSSDWDRAIALCEAVERRMSESDLIPVEPIRLVLGVAALQSGKLALARQRWRQARDHWLHADHVYLKSLFVAFDVMMSVELGESREVEDIDYEDDPDVATRLRAVIELERFDGSDLGTLLGIWTSLRPALQDFSGISVAARQLTIWLRARLPRELERLHRLEREGRGVIFIDDFAAFFVDGEWVDIQTKSTARTILRALCTSGQPLDFEDLGKLVYPDEIVPHQSLVNRINVHVSNMRRWGLKEHLVKCSDGFLFEGEFTLDPADASI